MQRSRTYSRSRVFVHPQLRQMQGNFTGMLTELDIAKAIDPEFCDLSFQYGTYYAAVRVVCFDRLPFNCVILNRVPAVMMLPSTPPGLTTTKPRDTFGNACLACTTTPNA